MRHPPSLETAPSFLPCRELKEKHASSRSSLLYVDLPRKIVNNLLVQFDARQVLVTLTTIQTPRINNQITAAELRLIDEEGKSLGVLSRAQALDLARERGTDLIEVVPNANPPVARLVSFDKYRYQKEKEAKKERQAQKTAGLKQIQVSARAALNDVRIKVGQLEKFLNEGHQVEVQLRLRGREKYNKDWAHHKLDELLKMITIEYKLLTPPKFGGRGLIIQIIKK